MRRALYVLVFSTLVAETTGMFADQWRTPLRLLSTFLFEYKPLVLPFLDVILLGLLVLGDERGPRPRSRALERAMAWSALGMLAWSAWGIWRGGVAYQVQFQLHAVFVAFLCALVMRRLLYTPQHFYTLGKIVIAAAGLRALMCIAFYVIEMRTGRLPVIPEFITTHDDTVLFVSAIVAVVANAIERPTSRNLRIALWVGLVVLLAIQFNNRRLAWVSLAGSLALVYLVLPPGSVKRRCNRALMVLAPLLALYVAVGWGRPEPMFKPLRALHTVSGQEDPSTRSRDAENQGLVVTLARHPLTGTGFGHEYVEIDNTLAAGTVFEQYRYLPHNSVLGLLAFAGMVGFGVTWMVFPVWTYLAAHVHRHASDGRVRAIALTALCEVLICLNQWWGDMGMFSLSAGVLMAGAMAASTRMLAFEDRAL